MAHDHDVYMTLADAAAQQEDAAGLALYLPRLEELAQRDSHRLYLGIAHRARGVAHRLAREFEEAHAQLDAALELFGELGTHWQIGRTLAELGELEATREAQEDAQRYFARALEEFETLGAEPDAVRVRSKLEV